VEEAASSSRQLSSTRWWAERRVDLENSLTWRQCDPAPSLKQIVGGAAKTHKHLLIRRVSAIRYKKFPEVKEQNSTLTKPTWNPLRRTAAVGLMYDEVRTAELEATSTITKIL
jgi:hypothetical protein